MAISGFFSNEVKSQIYNLLQRHHETWAEEIVMWKDPQRTVVLTNPSNFMGIYGDDQPTTENVTYTQVSGIFKARVDYPTTMPNYRDNLSIQGDASAKIQEVFVRIKLEESGYNFIKDSKKITVDGTDCEIFSTEKIHGIFEQKYYTFWLSKLK